MDIDKAEERLYKAINEWTDRVIGSYGDGIRARNNRDRIAAQRTKLEKAMRNYREACIAFGKDLP